MRLTRLRILVVTGAVFLPFLASAQTPAPPASPSAQNLPCKAEMDALNAKYPPSTNPDTSTLNAMTNSAESKALQDCLQKNMPSPAAAPQSYAGAVSAGAQSCPQLTRALSFGSRGPDVVQLQQYLISPGLLSADSATGYFGPLTEAAVQQWQSSHGVVSSGSAETTGYGAVGPRTRAALASACSGVSNPSTGSAPSSTSGQANQSLIDSLLAQVKVLQEKLAQLIAAKGGGGESGSTSQASCSWNGTTIASGSSVTAYQSSSVAYGSQCVSQQRTCTNNILSGSYLYAACSVQTASSPTATLTANGQTSLTVNVGDTINYAWSSTGAVSAKSSYTTDTPSCGQTTNGPFAWSPSTLSGTLSAGIAACGAGHTYTFTYTVTDANGQTASSQVTVVVSERTPHPYPNAFQILIDTNQLNPDEAAQASRFAADGVWSIPLNSPSGIDWPQTLSTLNADTWSVSEDNPGDTSQVDFVSSSQHRLVDGAMFYNEDGLATPLLDAQIAAYASHTVPGFGTLYARVVLLTRSFGDSDPRRAQLIHALADANVSGATFEFVAGGPIAELKIGEGCKYILSLGKKCYLLMPPSIIPTQDYVGDVQKTITDLDLSGGILDNPNVYIVLASYLRPNTTVHYLSASASDRNSIEAAVALLKAYRANPPDFKRPPQGWLDTAANCDHISGWSQDEDTSNAPTWVHFYISVPAGSPTLAGYTFANVYRSDLCSVIGSCNHGFDWSVPAQFRDGQPHTVYAFGIDTTIVAGTNNAQLSDSPKTFQCTQ